MNTQKLNELAASAMGWTAGKMMSREEYSREEVDVWKAPIGEGYRYFSKWNPCEDLNDASALLEKVAGNDWDCEKIAPDLYACFCGENPQGSTAKTLCEAIVLQSLRASGIPESSIIEATL